MGESLQLHLKYNMQQPMSKKIVRRLVYFVYVALNPCKQICLMCACGLEEESDFVLALVHGVYNIAVCNKNK